MRVTYSGPFAAVVLGEHVVKNGDSVDVPDAEAESLCQQECWSVTPKPAKKAAPKSDDPGDAG